MLQNSIGNKIATARKRITLSQADLARQISISSQAVGKWERGESMPDITTLIRLAEIFGVDLNYFSDNFQPVENSIQSQEASITHTKELPEPNTRKIFDWNWDMSRGNWVDADFSGLKNLNEKFSSSNMKNCKFNSSDMSGLILGSNNIEKCDFSFSDLRNSRIQSSNLSNNLFKDCSFIDAVFIKSNIEKCDFSGSNFSGAEFINGNFGTNTLPDAIWKFTAFKNTALYDITFEGTFEDCHFENCSFYKVKFQNAKILNTFFKYNSKFKKVQFIDCIVDKITYAFLKNNQADLSGITVLE